MSEETQIGMLSIIVVGHMGYITCTNFFVRQFNSQTNVGQLDVEQMGNETTDMDPILIPAYEETFSFNLFTSISLLLWGFLNIYVFLSTHVWRSTSVKQRAMKSLSSVCPSVCLSVTKFSQDWIIGLFWAQRSKSGLKWGFLPFSQVCLIIFLLNCI